MKTSEMIAMLEKDPKLKFKADNQLYLLGKDGYSLMWFSPDNRDKCGEASRIFGYDWQLVREPVLGWEAVRAYIDGKTITCEYGDCDINRFSLNRNTPGQHLSALLLVNGTWYIEDQRS